VPGTLRDSLIPLAVVLDQQTSLQPTQIITNTGAYSDVVFGLFRLLGYRFSSRLTNGVVAGVGDGTASVYDLDYILLSIYWCDGLASCPFVYYSSTVAVGIKVGGEVLFGSLASGGPFLGKQLCRYVKACTTPYVSTCGEGGWTAAQDGGTNCSQYIQSYFHYFLSD
jgi:hypothetical protein